MVVGMLKLPYKPRGEMFGVVREMNGASRATVLCEDEKNRVCRLVGKMKKKVWVRVGDLVIVRKWTIQENEKGDMIFRYTKTQREKIKDKVPEFLK